MIFITVFWGKSKKRPHDINEIPSLAIYIRQEQFLKQKNTLLNKRNDLFSKRRHIKINFCWPTLRDNCHCMIFNHLPQFLYKDKTKLHIWTCARSHYQLSFIDCIQENHLVIFSWQSRIIFTLKMLLVFSLIYIYIYIYIIYIIYIISVGAYVTIYSINSYQNKTDEVYIFVDTWDSALNGSSFRVFLKWS